ncbi:nucleotidyltransferase domain-containing protein [Parvicella tangerina]|uniref:Nucleotidyltransferase n=1 Tax=Parvicella tangerina TaxID=2829795 RepID=A0A916JKR5_9FLAO|nr:nucleotidyltransferase domain-containing protein [Parvicella tangerina]CAG5076340.1 hypothetical protein CRYO30217_00074 [Parvicella tangerina]
MKESHETEILNLIAYFDVFNYPLSFEELSKFVSISPDHLRKYIADLCEIGIISNNEDFIGTENLKVKIENRLVGNKKAAALKDKAAKNANLISTFPFVRGVLISGSFSKGFVSDDGDIDYFIITKPGRLWIARTFLILYKKLFLFNSHEYFCVNYFVDEDHLEIEEKNIFTATELVTLLPMVNKTLHQKLVQNNAWIKAYYPSLFHENNTISEPKRSTLQRFGEGIMKGKFGNKVDNYFMKLTLKRWQKKFGFLSNEDFEVAMKTTTNVSKHHPNNFQKKVLERHQEIFEKLIETYEENTNVKAAV